MLSERNLKHSNELCVCFVDFEKAFDRVKWTQWRSEQKFHWGRIPEMPPGIFRGLWAWLPKKISEHIRKDENKKLLFDCCNLLLIVTQPILHTFLTLYVCMSRKENLRNVNKTFLNKAIFYYLFNVIAIDCWIK